MVPDSFIRTGVVPSAVLDEHPQLVAVRVDPLGDLLHLVVVLESVPVPHGKLRDRRFLRVLVLLRPASLDVVQKMGFP
jgi:hypothetical protein